MSKYTHEEIWVMSVMACAPKITSSSGGAAFADAIAHEHAIRFVHRWPKCKQCGNIQGSPACQQECIPK